MISLAGSKEIRLLAHGLLFVISPGMKLYLLVQAVKTLYSYWSTASVVPNLAEGIIEAVAKVTTKNKTFVEANIVLMYTQPTRGFIKG